MPPADRHGTDSLRRAVEAPPAEVLKELERSLACAFGLPFTFWYRNTAWVCCSPRPRPGGGEQAGGLEPLLEAAAREPGVPLVRSGPRGEQLLVLALEPPESPLVVACGVVTLTTAELVKRLAHAFHRGLEAQRQLEDYRQQLGDYAQQVTDDLEEIQFLLSLSGHLELCDVRQSVHDVAASVLPVLRDLIRAESLVAVSAAEETVGDPCGKAQPATELFWFGPRVLADQKVLELVARFEHAAAERPVVRNRLAKDPQWLDFPGLDAFVLAAVGVRDSRAGWILAINRLPAAEADSQNRVYPEHGLRDSEFGSVEASMAAAAAVMLATHKRNLDFVRERETLLIGALRALINVIDAKDSYTCGHSDRVALIARRLGRQLGVDTRQRERLYLAGLLHDIGKIGIPDSVLLKAGKLTEEEFAQIKRHPERGYAILKHLKHLEEVLPAVLHHHERWDGRGYPLGLAGEQIPLAARIIAVADSYDAMTSCRPYRAAMPEEKAESILRSGAGSQWDPQVIEAFFAVLDDVRAICREAQRHTQAILNAQTGVPMPGMPNSDCLTGAVREIQA